MFRTAPLTRHSNISAVKCLHCLISEMNKPCQPLGKFVANLKGGDGCQGFLDLEITDKSCKSLLTLSGHRLWGICLGHGQEHG